MNKDINYYRLTFCIYTLIKTNEFENSVNLTFFSLMSCLKLVMGVMLSQFNFSMHYIRLKFFIINSKHIYSILKYLA